MTYIFGLIVIGGLMLKSGFDNKSILEAISDIAKPPTQSGLKKLTPQSGTNSGDKNDGQAEELGSDRSNSGGDLLLHLAQVADKQFHLRVGEYNAYGAKSMLPSAHAAQSYHKKKDSKGRGRAFDASGSAKNMRDFAFYVATKHGSQLSEGIHNPNLSIKNGERVPSSFWGIITWQGHRNHVHIAI